MKKSEREKLILQALMFAENQTLRWQDLMKKTNLSNASLAQSLKSLQKQQKIRRIVDIETDSYPPPVYYQLVDKVEREFSKKIKKEWDGIKERMDKNFELTFKNPEIYAEEIWKTIIRDSIFTLHYAVNAPNRLQALSLLGWHDRIHRKLIVDAYECFVKSKRHREALKNDYEQVHKELLEEEVRTEKRKQRKKKKRRQV